MKKSKYHINQPVIQSFFSFRPSYSLAYAQCINRQSYSHSHFTGGFNKPNLDPSHTTRKKVFTAVSWLVFLSSIKRVYCRATKKNHYFKLSFITLTLSKPQHHTDEFIKNKMLQPFIQWMIRQHNAREYVWKAETQANGNIHFHITTNVFIHWRAIRLKWNLLQSQYGYLNNLLLTDSLNDTNSTDVHAVKNDKSIAYYLSKYITKNIPRCNFIRYTCNTDTDKQAPDGYVYTTDKDGLVWMYRRPVQGRSWSASESLPTKGITIEQGSEAFDQLIEWLKVFTAGSPELLDQCTLYKHKKYSKNQLFSAVSTRVYSEIDYIRNKQCNDITYEIQTLL